MRIGIDINPFEESGYKRFGDNMYKKLAQHGYSCVDYGMENTESPLYTLPFEDAKKFLLREKELSEASGIQINQVHGPWRWPIQDSTPEDRAERLEKMKKSIRLTSVLGCKNFVIHPIMPFGEVDNTPEKMAFTWNTNIVFMRELLKTAKEYDVTICLENMPMLSFSIATPQDILRFVKEINDPNFKICLDTGHVSVFDGLSPADAVREFGDEIRVLHVHDNKFSKDLHLMPTLGIIDWTDFSKALKDINFKGVFSLEVIHFSKLETPAFEKMSMLLCEVANDIINAV